METHVLVWDFSCCKTKWYKLWLAKKLKLGEGLKNCGFLGCYWYFNPLFWRYVLVDIENRRRYSLMTPSCWSPRRAAHVQMFTWPGSLCCVLSSHWTDFLIEVGANRKREDSGKGKIEKRREEGQDPQPPHHSALGHFSLTHFFLGPSSRGQTIPAGACSKGTSVFGKTLYSPRAYPRTNI